MVVLGPFASRGRQDRTPPCLEMGLKGPKSGEKPGERDPPLVVVMPPKEGTTLPTTMNAPFFDVAVEKGEAGRPHEEQKQKKGGSDARRAATNTDRSMTRSPDRVWARIVT